MTSPIAAEALIPNPRLALFGPFIGVWNTVGQHNMMPGVTLHGRTAFEWHEAGGFVCVRSDIDEPRIPSAIAIIGSDDHSDGFNMLYFDERAISRRFEMAIEGRVLRWWRLVTDFSQRYVLTVSLDGKTLHGVSSLCKDGKHWEQDMEQSYSREL
ncbi:MAG: hypothetical protein ABJC26_15380 [Gemmatimonadaceae bacterium]